MFKTCFYHYSCCHFVSGEQHSFLHFWCRACEERCDEIILNLGQKFRKRFLFYLALVAILFGRREPFVQFIGREP